MFKSVLAAIQSTPSASASSPGAQQTERQESAVSGIFHRLQEIAQVAVGYMNFSRSGSADPEQTSRINSHLTEMHKAVSAATHQLDRFTESASRGQLSLGDVKTAGKSFSNALSAAIEIDRNLSAADRKALSESSDAKLVMTELHGVMRDLAKTAQERFPQAYAEAKRRDFCLTARNRFIDELESIAVSDEDETASSARPHSETILDLAQGIEEAFNPANPNVQALHDAAYKAWERDCALALDTPGGLAVRPNEELVLTIKERIEIELLAKEPALGAQQAKIHTHFSALDDQILAVARQYETRFQLEVPPTPPSPASTQVEVAAAILDSDALPVQAERSEVVVEAVEHRDSDVIEVDEPVAAAAAPEITRVARTISLPITSAARPVQLTELTVSAQPKPVEITPLAATVELEPTGHTADEVVVVEAAGEPQRLDLVEVDDSEPLGIVAPEVLEPEHREVVVEAAEDPAPVLTLTGVGEFVASASSPVVSRRFGRPGWSFAAAAAVMVVAALGAHFSSAVQKKPEASPQPQVALNTPVAEAQTLPIDYTVSTPEDAPLTVAAAVKPPASTNSDPFAVPLTVEPETHSPVVSTAVPEVAPDNSAVAEAQNSNVPKVDTQELVARTVAALNQTVSPFADQLDSFWRGLQRSAADHAAANSAPTIVPAEEVSPDPVVIAGAAEIPVEITAARVTPVARLALFQPESLGQDSALMNAQLDDTYQRFIAISPSDSVINSPLPSELMAPNGRVFDAASLGTDNSGISSAAYAAANMAIPNKSHIGNLVFNADTLGDDLGSMNGIALDDEPVRIAVNPLIEPQHLGSDTGMIAEVEGRQARASAGVSIFNPSALGSTSEEAVATSEQSQGSAIFAVENLGSDNFSFASESEPAPAAVAASGNSLFNVAELGTADGVHNNLKIVDEAALRGPALFDAEGLGSYQEAEALALAPDPDLLTPRRQASNTIFWADGLGRSDGTLPGLAFISEERSPMQTAQLEGSHAAAFQFSDEESPGLPSLFGLADEVWTSTSPNTSHMQFADNLPKLPRRQK